MRSLTIAGVLSDNGRFHLTPGFVVDGEVRDEGGDLDVVILDRSERKVVTTRLALGTPCAVPNGAPDAPEPGKVVFGLVAFPENAAELRVEYGGKVLLRRTAPATATRVDVVWPADIGRAPVQYKVRWEASSKDCLAALGYSGDGGRTWSPISAPSSSAEMVVNGATLPGGRRCLFELIVTDGWATTRVRSPEFEAPPKGWLLWIVKPVEQEVFESGDEVLLVAQNLNVERRITEPGGIHWSSSLDGRLGSGKRVETALSRGTHVISAQIHDKQERVTVIVR